MRQCLNNIIESAFYNCNGSKDDNGKILRYSLLVNPVIIGIICVFKACRKVYGSISASRILSWPHGLTQNFFKPPRIFNIPNDSQYNYDYDYSYNYTIEMLSIRWSRSAVQLKTGKRIKMIPDLKYSQCQLIEISTVWFLEFCRHLPSGVVSARKEGYYSTPVMADSVTATHKGKLLLYEKTAVERTKQSGAVSICAPFRSPIPNVISLHLLICWSKFSSCATCIYNSYHSVNHCGIKIIVNSVKILNSY